MYVNRCKCSCPRRRPMLNAICHVKTKKTKTPGNAKPMMPCNAILMFSETPETPTNANALMIFPFVPRNPPFMTTYAIFFPTGFYNLDFSATSKRTLDRDLVDDLRRSAPSLALRVLGRRSTAPSSSSDSSTVKRSGDGSRQEWRWPERVREYRRRFCTLRATSSCARPRVGSVMVIRGGLICDTMCGVSLRRSSSRPMKDSSSSSWMVAVWYWLWRLL